MSEENEQVVDVVTAAKNAGYVARDTVGFADLGDPQKKTVDSGVHNARVKIRGGLSKDLVPLAIQKAQLQHDAFVATLQAFADGTEPSGVYAEAAAWGQV